MSKKIKFSVLFPLLSLLAIIFFTKTANAWFTDYVNFDTKVESGNIKITLEMLEKNETGDGTQPMSKGQNISPGSKISMIPQISSNGIDCYVRVLLSVVDSSGELSSEKAYSCTDYDQNIWVLRGNYLYCKKPLTTSNPVVKVFENFTVPLDILSTDGQNVFNTNIKVEAVQAANVNFDFSSDNPWNDIEI